MKNCESCGKELTRRQARFCSRKCFGKWVSATQRGENHPNWKGGATKHICKVCGKEFRTYHTAQGRGQFCSRACLGKWQSVTQRGKNHPSWKGGPAEYACEVCGKTFKAGKSEREKGWGRFCSQKCQADWQSVTRRGENHHAWESKPVEHVCEICGETFNVHRSRHLGGQVHCCSKKCQAEWQSITRRRENSPTWKGGLSFGAYPASFNREFKQAIRNRDNHTCAVCWLPGLDVHHINYKKEDTIPENCITLCRPCHSTTNYNRAYWEAALTDITRRRSERTT